MSVVIQVFLAGERMPAPEAWTAALRAHGFDADLDTDFDVRDSTGFRPCKYEGHDAGFEYYFEPAGPVLEAIDDSDELAESLREATVGRDSVVSFVTHADWREFATSAIASGVLCAITDGVLVDDRGISASGAIAWAKECERIVQAKLRAG